MRKRRLLIFAGAAMAVAGISGLILWKRASKLRPAPVSAVYVGHGDFTNGGVLRSGPTFWLTNHTSKALAVNIWSVEVRDGTNWTKRSYRPPYATPIMLAPSAGAYATVDFSSQPQPTSSWRLELRAAEKLSQLESAILAIKRAPSGWRQVHGMAIPIPKLLEQMKGRWYGHPIVVMSDEVAEQ